MRSPLPRSSSTRPTAAPSPLGFIDRPGGRGGRADLTTGPLGGISHRTSSLIPRPPSACITLDRPRAQPHSTQFTCPRNRIKASEAYADLELDAKVELIRALVPLGLLHVQELLDQEVTALAGARYAVPTRN